MNREEWYDETGRVIATVDIPANGDQALWHLVSKLVRDLELLSRRVEMLDLATRKEEP